MQITHIAADQREEWNSFVAREPFFALLQSWEWGEFKEKLGWRAIRIALEEKGQIVAGAQVLIKPFPMGWGSVAYIPRGPIGNWLDQEIAPELFSEIHRVARQHRAIFMKIEPAVLNNPGVDQVLQQHRFQRSAYTNQPRATLILDLKQDLDAILKQMRDKTRQYIRSADRAGVCVRVGNYDDLSSFYNLMRLTSQRGQFPHRTRAYYEYEWQTLSESNRGVLLMAFYQNQPLAVRTVCCFGENAAEFHAGSSGEYANLHANYLSVWEGIKWAKARGCCTYDLWGIPDEVGQSVYAGKGLPVSDRTDGLWGVYRFKSGFSKKVVFYVGAYDYVYVPLLYTLTTNRLFGPDVQGRIAVRMDSVGRARA